MFSIRAGWGLLKILISVVFLPLTILGFLIGGIIHLSVPILVIIGLITVVKSLTGERVSVWQLCICVLDPVTFGLELCGKARIRKWKKNDERIFD